MSQVETSTQATPRPSEIVSGLSYRDTIGRIVAPTRD